jgi:hypothetical protein
MNIKTKWAVILSITLTSCTKPYSFDIDNIEKRIVVNSFLCTDSTFMANLVEEAALNDKTFLTEDGFVISNLKPINNANIIIYNEDIIIDTLDIAANGNYFGHTKPDFNKNYKIVIYADGFNKVEANNKLPTMVKIDSIRKKKIDEEYNDRYQLTIFFNDPPNEKNYYYISISGLTTNYSTEDPVIGEWHSNWRQIPIFSDELFNGKTYGLKIMVNVNISDWYEPEWNYIAVNLHTISQDYFLFVESYNKQTPKFGDDIIEMFQQGLIEPIPIYSNIDGGLGLFGSYTNSVDTVHFGNN